MSIWKKIFGYGHEIEAVAREIQTRHQIFAIADRDALLGPGWNKERKQRKQCAADVRERSAIELLEKHPELSREDAYAILRRVSHWLRSEV